VAAVSLTAVVAAALPRHDMAQATLHVLPVALAIAAAAGALMWLALRPVYRPRLPRLVLPGAVLAATLLPIALAFLPGAQTSAAGVPFSDFARGVATCLGLGALIGVPFLALAWVLDRGGHGSLARALAAGAAAGLVSNMALEFHCACVDPAHLLAGHGSLVVAFLGAYALLRRR
jgi:hypothetical protein